MTEPEKLFHQIIKGLSTGFEGNMFGAKCIKSANNKTAAYFWQNVMVFKLDDKNREEALNLRGSKFGTHLYAPEKTMKGWVSIPMEHSDKWKGYAEKALKYVDNLKKEQSFKRIVLTLSRNK